MPSRYENRQTGRFKVADENGNILEVQEFTEFINITPLDPILPQWTPGLKSYRLASGEALTQLTDEDFLVVLTDRVLTRVKE